MKNIALVLLLLCISSSFADVPTFTYEDKRAVIAFWSWENCQETLISYSKFESTNQSNDEDEAIFNCAFKTVEERTTCENDNQIENMKEIPKAYYQNCVVAYLSDAENFVTTDITDKSTCFKVAEKCQKCQNDVENCVSVFNHNSNKQSEYDDFLNNLTMTVTQSCPVSILGELASVGCDENETLKSTVNWIKEEMSDDVCLQIQLCQNNIPFEDETNTTTTTTEKSMKKTLAKDKSSTSVSQPKPTVTKPKPTETKPKPTETKPKPTDTKPKPKPTETKPQPTTQTKQDTKPLKSSQKKKKKSFSMVQTFSSLLFISIIFALL